MTLQLSLPTEQGRAGKPRLNPYSRLLSRFYESLFLLYSLNNTRAAHLPYPISGSLEQGQRREFMRSLAFVCDGRKGGQSFTAFAVAEVEGEDVPDEGEFVFLVSSKKATKCKLMLERSLTALLQYTTAKQEKMAELQRRFLDRCVEYARERITAYILDLRRAIPGCIAEVESQKQNVINDKFIGWLNSLLLRYDGTSKSHFNVCVDICRASVSAAMRLKLYQEEQRQQHSLASQGTLPHGRDGCFARARHAIGRLSSRVTKPLSLLQNASLMKHILSRARVVIIDSLECVPKPLVDHQTTLPRILRRMFHASDKEDFSRTQKILEDMERNSSLRPLTLFMDCFRSCKPTVHSEVEVLEHFYRYKLKFLDNDRYVYSSKPACFACKLYFTHHPAKMVVPESHEKVYLNWGPPMIQGFCKGDPASDLQRVLMNKITQVVRDEALGQVLGRNQPLGWHADSTTGLDTLPALQSGFQSDIATHWKHHYTTFEAYDSGFESGSVQEFLDAIEQKKGKKDEVESEGPVAADALDVLKGMLDGMLREDRARDTGSNDQETDDDEGGALL